MNKFSIGLFTLVLTILNSSYATEYPQLNKYEETARMLLSATQGAKSSNVNQLERKTRELVAQGMEVMNLFQSKNPQCTEQYKVIADELSTMETMTVEAAHLKYHDGEGLPKAEGCYLGRSQVVHPVLNLIRLKQTFNEEVRAAMIADLEEVIEHVGKIQTRLDKANP